MRWTSSIASAIGPSIVWADSEMRSSLMRKKDCSTSSRSRSMPSACAWAFSTVVTAVEMSCRRKCFSRMMASQCGACALEEMRPVSSLT